MSRKFLICSFIMNYTIKIYTYFKIDWEKKNEKNLFSFALNYVYIKWMNSK